MSEIGNTFLYHSGTFLTDAFLPRIERAVERLSEEDIWWRPNAASNSIGNLMLHLEGNLRQWIVSGAGGAPDVRRREEEFSRVEPMPADELKKRLRETVVEAGAVLASIPRERLLEEVVIQRRKVTVLEAIYHAIEHFSMHTGQIVYIAKLRTGEDLGFYEVVDGTPVRRW